MFLSGQPVVERCLSERFSAAGVCAFHIPQSLSRRVSLLKLSCMPKRAINAHISYHFLTA